MNCREQMRLNEIFDLVIRLNGTLSGEHGVGAKNDPTSVRK